MEGYGDPPIPEFSEESFTRKFFEEQTTELTKLTTANMLYKAAHTRYYSALQEIPYAPFEIGDKKQAFPYQWMKGGKNLVFGLNFDPVLFATDGHDGCERKLVGNGPFGTADIEIMWCTDDLINMFLQNLRDDKDAIREAAMRSHREVLEVQLCESSSHFWISSSSHHKS